MVRLFNRKSVSEAGRRNSAVDQARIQEAHDHMVGLGAVCSEAAGGTKDTCSESANQKLLNEALRVDDSFSARIELLRKAARAMFTDGSYDGPYVYVRDCFDSDVVVQVGDATFQIPYTVDGNTVTLGDPIEVDVAYIPADDSDDVDETADEILERDIPQSTRKKLSKGDFAGKGKSFPIQKAEDVKAALDSIGRAGADNYDAATLKKNILRIAKRKGFPIPKSDAKEMDSEKVTAPVTEAATCDLSGDYIQLREGAVAADGSAQIKIIQPGWGSSGYYPAEVLKRDGPKVFAKGLKMFWDHQTAEEEAARPEGSLDDLAAEFTANATWQEAGPDGPGLYAPIDTFEAYAPAINDLAKSIGVSIRAAGRAAKGKAPDGKEGLIIQSLESARSVDFVTSPGAGGKILQLFEAARGRNPKPQNQELEMQEAKDLKEANALLTQQSAELAKLRESVIVGQAATFVRESLASVSLPAIVKQRLTNELVAAMPVKDNALDTAAYTTKIAEAVKAAVAEIAAITGAGEVKGLGAAPAMTVEEAKKTQDELTGALQRMGLSESAAQLAAKGR